jgi:plasmid stabilization system protein ParE
LSRPSARLTVIYADDALREIDEIADWNEKTYGRALSSEYVQFLRRHIEALAKEFEKGKPVSTRADLRHIRIQKRSKAYGHVAVYIFDDQVVTVVHVFHTSQDWENKLAKEQE